MDFRSCGKGVWVRMGIFSKLAERLQKQKLFHNDGEELLVYLSEGIKELEKVESFCVTLNVKNYHQSSNRKRLWKRLLQAKIWFEKAQEVEQKTRLISNISMEIINKGRLRMKILNSKEAAFVNSLDTGTIFSSISKLNYLLTFPDELQQFMRTVVEMVVSIKSLKEDLEKLIALEERVMKIYYEAWGS